jgi:arylformamidase
MKIIDISPPLSDRMIAWPGDTRFHRTTNSDLILGGALVSEIVTSLHAGAHADAPNHVVMGGADIATVPLEPYIGRCVVVDARRSGPRPLTSLDANFRSWTAPRVLLRTDTFIDWSSWNESFASLTLDLVDALRHRGAVLVGIDTPSVDTASAGDLPVHRALADARVAVLEGLMLAGVDEGEYELIAPPLRIEGGDASPVRALLRTIE